MDRLWREVGTYLSAEGDVDLGDAAGGHRGRGVEAAELLDEGFG